MSNYQICFIGNAIVDIISKFSDENLKELKIPKGSMQLIDEKSSNLILNYLKNPIIISGGSAANTAVGFSSFGGNCSFIGQIGNDDFGILFSKDLNNSGVFFENKITQTLRKTSKSIVLVTPDAERSMNTYLGASIEFDIDSINKDLIRDVIILDIYKGEKIPQDMKSVAIKVTIQPIQETLTDSKLEEISAHLINAIHKKLSGSLREI